GGFELNPWHLREQVERHQQPIRAEPGPAPWRIPNAGDLDFELAGVELKVLSGGRREALDVQGDDLSHRIFRGLKAERRCGALAQNDFLRVAGLKESAGDHGILHK